MPRLGVITQAFDPAANSYSAAALRGLEFAVREMNAAGGALIELVVEDDIGRLIEAQVCFAISLLNSVATMAAQEVAREARLPLLAPCQSGKQLATARNPWFWHTGPTSTLQVKTLVSLCRKRGYRSVEIVGDESQLSRLLARAFADEISACGLRQVEAGADAVISAGVLVPDLLALLEARRARAGAPLLGSYNFSLTEVQEQAGALMDGVAYVDAFDPRKPQARAFAAAYARQTGNAPGSVEGYGYDAVQLVADAIRRAGGVERESVRAAMQATDAVGVLGAIGATYAFRDGGCAGFDPQGLVVRMHGRPAAEGVVHVGAR